MHAQGQDRIERIERQIRIPIVVNSVPICVYVVDFLVTYADGRRELVEVKGIETAVFRLKLKLLCATWLKDHPNINYRIVK